MKYIFIFFELLSVFCNYLKYKLLFRDSKRFYIKGKSKIIGFRMISIGNFFFANNLLRIEVFGNNSTAKLIIGDNVAVGQNVHIGVNNFVSIKSNVLIGSNVLITDHNHGLYSGINQSDPLVAPVLRPLTTDGFVIINENVWIGDGVSILPNVEIGKGSIVATNSTVTRNIPENVIAGGIPCKVIKRYNTELKKWEKL